MADILLATLNARFIHASFGLRYLFANLGDLQARAALMEFEIKQRPLEIAEKLLDQNPKILGLGVYIWNAPQTLELVRILKRLRPHLVVILGGPEVSHETDDQPLCRLADYTIMGEADLVFAQVCRDILDNNPPPRGVIAAALPDVQALKSPYALYTDHDIQHRVIYVEASRGCPFRCEFCLSSLDIPVRQFALERFLPALESLLQRGVNQFKFVDRTFNLSIPVSTAILRFFLERMRPGLFVHFEMVPDRLPPELRELIRQFPAGTLQFEVGIQTFNPEVATLISRRQNYAKLEENLRFLRASTGVHIHADLIAGLPGETIESFGAGFDRLLALEPHEIQVGILKRLRGTPISRHDAEWGMIYSPDCPYEILENKLIAFSEMQNLRRFARYWDLVYNSGNFRETAPTLWSGHSAFAGFKRFSVWLYGRTRRTDAISLTNLSELLFEYLTKEAGQDPAEAARTLLADYRRTGHNDTPVYLRNAGTIAHSKPKGSRADRRLPKRQTRHAPLRSPSEAEV